MRHPGPTDHADFTQVLDARARAVGASPEAGGPASHVARPTHGIGSILEGTEGLPRESSPGSAQALAGIYERSLEVPQPDLAGADPQAVAGALGLSPELTREDLHRIRRDFALSNHPDRVTPPSRDVATRRMAIANTLIDRALQAKSKPAA